MSDGAATERRKMGRIAALAALLSLAAGAIIYALSARYPPERSAVTDAEIGTAKAPATPGPAEEGQAEPEIAAAPEDPDPAEPPVLAVPAVPSVDVVRIEPGGRALVAGSAEPGARVAIMADNRQVGVAEADSSGDFVAIFTAEPSSGPQLLSLEAESAEGSVTRSEDVVLLLPAAESGFSEAAAEPTATEESETPADEAVALLTDQAAATTPIEESDEEFAAVAIVRSDGVEATPLSRPTEADPRDVALASISYGTTGDVALSGFGTAGVRLRAYVDDAFAREATVDADGRWEIGLGDVDQGLYTLRIDAVDAEGRVESRLETPFQRDLPRPRPGAEPGSVVVVQPGTNLWTLARIHYGSGVLYTQIFTANRDLIRDPNLIYPGQIFALPEAGPEN